MQRRKTSVTRYATLSGHERNMSVSLEPPGLNDEVDGSPEGHQVDLRLIQDGHLLV